MTSEEIARWKRQVRQISDWLYERDPDGVSGAPHDEYADAAIRVLSGVQHATNPEECAAAVRNVFSIAPPDARWPTDEDARWLMQFTRHGTAPPARHPCPCCGHLTYLGPPPDDADDENALCPVCGWISDGLQNTQPKASGMPNVLSLEQSRENFARYGAANPGDDRVRPPTDAERPPEVVE